MSVVTNSTNPLVCPSFCAYISVDQDNVTGDGTTYQVIYQTKTIDTTNSYNATTGIYTIPISGNYIFSGNLLLSGLTASHNSLIINITKGPLEYNIIKINPKNLEVSGQEVIYWADTLTNISSGAQVYLTLTISGGTKVVSLPSFLITSTFSGRQIR